MLSPSSMGRQNFRVYQVASQNKKQNLIKATYGQGYVSSSLVLVFCSNPKRIKMMGTRGKNLFAVQDATIAAAYAQLAATELGLASVWIGHFDETKVAKIIGTKLRPVSIIPIGYANEKPKPKKSQKAKELFKKV